MNNNGSDAANPGLPEASPQRPTHVRHWVVGIAALMSLLLYLDRFCISFVEIYIQEDLGLSDSEVGWMLSAFFWTYALSQVPAGWLTDRFGSRLMLTLYVVLWSLFTGWTGAAGSFAMLMLLRFGLGVAQAGAYPTASSMVSRWVPIAQRGTASAVIAYGGRVGGVLAMFASGYLLIWLTPPEAPTRLGAEQLMNPGLVCYELVSASAVLETPRLATTQKPSSVETPEVSAEEQLVAQARRAVLEQFSDSGRSLVVELSAEYGSAWDARIALLKSEGRPVDGVVVNDLAVDGPEVEQLARELNRFIASPAATASQWATLPNLEAEAVRMLEGEGLGDDGASNERLGRLVVEALHPQGVKKLYIHGWRKLMVLYGGLGVIVGALIWWGCRTTPKSHPWCNEAEVKLIEAGTFASGDVETARVPWGGLVTSFSMWMSCCTQWFTNIGWVFLVTWAPRYYSNVHDLPTETRVLYVSIPPFIGWGGMLLGGFVTDWMTKRLGLRWGRAAPIAISRFLAMGAYIGCLFQPSPIIAVCLFSVVAFSTDLGTAPVWAFTQDVGGKQVGSVLGWGNMWGNLGAAVTPPLLIAIVGETQNWNAAFAACAAAFFVAGLCGLGIDGSKPIKGVA